MFVDVTAITRICTYLFHPLLLSVHNRKPVALIPELNITNYHEPGTYRVGEAWSDITMPRANGYSHAGNCFHSSTDVKLQFKPLFRGCDCAEDVLISMLLVLGDEAALSCVVSFSRRG